MARIRTIKPEFWRHPVISRLPDQIQLMALALLSMADDEGYFHADPAIVRGEVMPFREDLARISECLAHLSKVGWIDLWDHPEQGQMGVVVNWSKHQKIDHASKSKLKTYDIRETLARTSRDTRATLAPDQGSGNRDQGTGNRDQITLADAPAAKPARKTPQAVGPTIATSNGPWSITVGAAKQRMATYGMTEAQMIGILERVAKHNTSLPAEKLPGAAAMHSILHAWFAKHSPGSDATEVAPRAPKLDPDAYAAALAAQNEFFPRETA